MLRSTSMVKSTCPGVSMTLIRVSCQKAWVTAEVMVMPRSRSCSIQSIWEAPSWVSPVLWMRPVKNSMRSVSVVLPASMWAAMPMLRVCARSVLIAVVMSSLSSRY